MKKIKKVKWLIPLLAIAIASIQCRKNKADATPKTELEKLSPITQIGANTFGCLVNGIAWLPNGTKPQNGGLNIQVYVDPTFQGGAFAISGYKYNDGSLNFLDFSVSGCLSSGIYSTLNNILIVQYSKLVSSTHCLIASNAQAIQLKTGILNITKYDLTNQIYSGTFEATLFNANTCSDTIKITNGRFDVKL